MDRCWCTLKALFKEPIVPKFIDRTGQRFGKLMVVKRNGTDACRKVLWECLCDCGKTTFTPSGSLVTGNTTSCGCITPNFKHGGWKKASYNTWRAMMRRCYNPKDKDYPKYGGRGVYVHPDWHEYATFAAFMGEPLSDETLDRVDPYGSYTPENCRWASVRVQNRNLRVRENSKSGFIGVIAKGPKWLAQITVGRKKHYGKLRLSVTEAAADRAYLERLHWGVS